MINCDDGTLKRSLLLGARIRFSPSGANVRSQAIERIIEQNLASNEVDTGLTEQDLQHLVTLGGQISVLRMSDLRQGITSLKQSGRIIDIRDGWQQRYLLSPEARLEVAQIVTETEEHTKATIKELFGNVFGEKDIYQKAFLRLLCKVFSELSEVYIHDITRKPGNTDLAEHRLLSVVIEETIRSEQLLDPDTFRYGVNRFFRESTPQFDQIKWNMAQNFYVAKALGLDTSSDLLSSDIFKDASLYCDTNVLIAGLIPGNRHYRSFKEMARSCNTIGMSLKATHLTIEELQWVISAQGDLLRKVIDRIPDETRAKVRNFFLEAYLSEKEVFPNISIDDFIDSFQRPKEILQDSFGLLKVDDVWFNIAFEDNEVRIFAKEISQKYKEMRGRAKSEIASLHDAALAIYVANENKNQRKSWIITLDITPLLSPRLRRGE
ncbi:MAG: hypothetical protein AB1585_13535 [Thermodesulfobacteriota bacterium]